MSEKEFFHVVMVYEQMPGTYNMYRWGIDSIFSTKEAAKRYIDTGNPDSDFDENEEEHLDDLDYWMRNYDCELYRGCLVVKRGFDDRPCYDGIWEVRFDKGGKPVSRVLLGRLRLLQGRRSGRPLLLRPSQRP